MVQLPSQCFVAACVLWCDWEWWQFQQAVGSLLDPHCRETSWRHQRPGPHLRWESVFIKTLGDHWKRKAASVEWKRQRGAFRVQAYKIFGARPFEDRYVARPGCTQEQPPTKRPRTVHRCPVEWSWADRRMPRIEIMGDSSLIINWLNGLWKCKYRVYAQRLRILHDTLERMARKYFVAPRQDYCEWSRHIYRELNGEADILAGRHRFTYQDLCRDTSFNCFRLFFDGSCNRLGTAGG